MMTDKRTRKQWMIAAVVLAVLVYSAAGIDYSKLLENRFYGGQPFA